MSNTRIPIIILLLALLLLVGQPTSLAAKDQPKDSPDTKEPATDAPRTGRYTMERKGVPARLALEVLRRGNYDPTAPWVKKYVFEDTDGPEDLARWNQEDTPLTWKVCVPEDYSPTKPPGVMVGISSGGGGYGMRYHRMINQHNLILVSPEGVGNKQPPSWRIAAGLRGLEIIRKRYEVDSNRIYVMGFSGGGRVASRMMFNYPDLFAGGFPHCGANHFRDVRNDDRRWTSHLDPGPKRLRQARKNRFVYYTAKGDVNRPEMRVKAKDLKQLGFYIVLLDAPAGGHSGPKKKWMEKGLNALDKPLHDGAAKAFKQAKKLVDRSPGQALGKFREAAMYGNPNVSKPASEQLKTLQQNYDQAIEKIRSTLKNERPGKAMRKLSDLKRTWGKAADDDVETLRKEIRESLRSK